MENVLSWGYPGLFLCGLLAGSIVPMNVEAPLSAAIALGWPSWYCFLFAWIGDWLGASTNYFIGRLASPEWIEKYARVGKDKMEKAQRFMQGKGVWLAALNFLPTIGNAIIIILGMTRASFWKVFLFLGISIFLRFLLWMLLTQGVIQIIF